MILRKFHLITEVAMSNYELGLSQKAIYELGHSLGYAGSKVMTEGDVKYLGDIKLSDAIRYAQESEVYRDGRFQGINTADFLPVFARADVDINSTINEVNDHLNKEHLKNSKPDGYQLPPFLKFAFKDEGQPILPIDISDAAQLLQHVLCVVSGSEFCHNDFDETQLFMGEPEHVRFLSLK